MWNAVSKTLPAFRIRFIRVHFHTMLTRNPMLGVVNRRLSSEVPAGWNGNVLFFSNFSNSFSRSLGTLAQKDASTDEELEASTPSSSQVHHLFQQLVKEDVSDCIKGDQTSKFQNRSNFTHHQHSFHSKFKGMSPSKYALLKRRQIKLETEAWRQAAEEYRELLSEMCERKLAPNLPYMKSLFMNWFEPLRDKISKEQKFFISTNKYPAYAPYFILLPDDMMAVVTMHKLMGLLMTGDGSAKIQIVKASIHIGSAIEQEVQIRRFMEKKTKKNIKKKNDDDDEDTNDVNAASKDEKYMRKKVSELVRKRKMKVAGKIMKAYDHTKPWGQAIQAKVGSRLIEMLIEVAYIQPPVDQSGAGFVDIRPAFRHVQKFPTTPGQKNRTYGAIECDPLVRKGLEKTARHMVIPYIPMLVPPVDWTGHDKGAHFYLPSHIMKTHGSKQLNAMKTASKEQMQNVYKALNTLGNTKWRINKRVLSIVDRIWSNGGNLASLVDQEDVPLPEKPNTNDDDKIKKWKWSLSLANKENSERHSQRCDIELKLSVARKLMDEEGFYYPHNIDFRGRAYPMHPYLNHLGSDLCRGILEFAEGRTLGKSGLQWLKIHLANLYGGGFDKLSLDGRATFAENHVEDIFDSADRPLEGRRWWLEAEDPFQCLALCINLAVALRSSSPESTISHLPIHQDGSCNGLQHYSALGRDKLGADAVNLVTNDKPSDLYSDVARRVFLIMKEDSMGDPIDDPNASIAKLLIDQVDRKLVKQTVMTSVYGVTFVGAREQIKKRLKERNFNGADEDNQLFRASSYAAKVTLTALGEIFTAANEIKAWLEECAKIIAMENHPVMWTTPIGIPAVQPYMGSESQIIRTSLQSLCLQRETNKVAICRQKSAFPPNFVHSLDGAHMMMSAIACGEAGLNFAGVHDSYWTHACDVDVMNRILREEFVKLHETPILENLLDDFQKCFPLLEFPPVPNRGDFDLREVLDSTYFFN